MQVILQGSLRHFAAADLLSFLCRPGHKGTLDLESAGLRTRILFENDTILSAQSKKAGDGADAVLEALEWTEGTFTVLDAAVLPAGTQPLALRLPPLFEEAKKRAAEKAGFPDATVFHVIEDPALQQQVSLTSDEFRLLFRLAAGRTFADLLAEFAVPRKELAERLKKLEAHGLIASDRPEPEGTVLRPLTRPQPPLPAPVQPEKKAAERATRGGQASAPPAASGEKTGSPGARGPAPAATLPPPPTPVPPPPARQEEMRTVAENVPVPAAVPSTEQEAERTMMQLPVVRAKAPTLVGSLTPDDAPDDVFPLLDAECIIGRRNTKEVAFAINDGSISSKHARLLRTPEGFVIEDLGSKNGTFVNGEKVGEKRVLNDGDLIRLGKVIMTFNVAKQNQASEQTQPEIRLT